MPDVGLLTLTEFADEARRLAAATSLPLLCDADTGFGEVLNVERTVSELESAGAAGIHLEDQQSPKTMRASLGQIAGRTGGDGRQDPRRGLPRSVTRTSSSSPAPTPAESPASTTPFAGRTSTWRPARTRSFPKALESADEFARFAREVQAPLLANMTEFGKGPLLSVADLGAMGYKMVLYPLTAFRSAMKAAADTLTQLRDAGHQRDALPRMMTRAELYDLLDYPAYEARDQAYFKG